MPETSRSEARDVLLNEARKLEQSAQNASSFEKAFDYGARAGALRKAEQRLEELERSEREKQPEVTYWFCGPLAEEDLRSVTFRNHPVPRKGELTDLDVEIDEDVRCRQSGRVIDVERRVRDGRLEAVVYLDTAADEGHTSAEQFLSGKSKPA